MMAVAEKALTPHQRTAWIKAGVRIEYATIGWMLVEAALSIGAGLIAQSLLLVTFGLDRVIELVSGGILLWRLTRQVWGGSLEMVEQAERRAAWIVAFALMGLILYVVGSSGLDLVTHAKPGDLPGGSCGGRCCGHRDAALGLAQTADRCPSGQCRLTWGCRLLDDVCGYGGHPLCGPGGHGPVWLVVGRKRRNAGLLVLAGARSS